LFICVYINFINLLTILIADDARYFLVDLKTTVQLIITMCDFSPVQGSWWQSYQGVIIIGK
jgi:hypothetical protein